ncbi:hypothetical protein M0R45_026333 [Rubus argutus]|uniref:Uncharacterized protein n=1 Tax=Rubus argutus TaxID=59490 RepID=A0AAW1WX66_RUBAR
MDVEVADAAVKRKVVDDLRWKRRRGESSTGWIEKLLGSCGGLVARSRSQPGQNLTTGVRASWRRLGLDGDLRGTTDGEETWVSCWVRRRGSVFTGAAACRLVDGTDSTASGWAMATGDATVSWATRRRSRRGWKLDGRSAGLGSAIQRARAWVIDEGRGWADCTWVN